MFSLYFVVCTRWQSVVLCFFRSFSSLIFLSCACIPIRHWLPTLALWAAPDNAIPDTTVTLLVWWVFLSCPAVVLLVWMCLPPLGSSVALTVQQIITNTNCIFLHYCLYLGITLHIIFVTPHSYRSIFLGAHRVQLFMLSLQLSHISPFSRGRKLRLWPRGSEISNHFIPRVSFTMGAFGFPTHFRRIFPICLA